LRGYILKSTKSGLDNGVHYTPHVDDLKKQIITYKKFKALMEKWIDLSIEHSKTKMELANRNKLE